MFHGGASVCNTDTKQFNSALGLYHREGNKMKFERDDYLAIGIILIVITFSLF